MKSRNHLSPGRRHRLALAGSSTPPRPRRVATDEWSLKKWTREEDTKLLRNVKVLPTLWRTIASIMGRSPSECLQRYDKLCDAACGTPSECLQRYEKLCDVKDDDQEMQLLYEARERLAKRRFKKAKREARVKQVELALRLGRQLKPLNLPAPKGTAQGQAAKGTSFRKVEESVSVEEEAENLINEEAKFLCVTTPTLHEFVESMCDGNMKLSGLQSEFKKVKKTIDYFTRKAQNLEHKVKVLTHGYKVRAEKFGTRIEETFKQLANAETELNCIQVLQKQERLAAPHRITNIREEVQRLKDLEQTLQKRYGELLVEKERMEAYCFGK